MKVLLRADAGREQGTGHVMRCLTLAEALLSRGHSVQLMGSIAAVPWLESVIASSRITVHQCEADVLDIDSIIALEPDWVVVDSYRIDARAISRLCESVPCLAIVDGDARGITASLYVDQNLGAENRDWPDAVRSRLLAGHTYCLVRDDFIRNRLPTRGRTERSALAVTAFMGGTDPRGAIVDVATSLTQSRLDLDLTLIAPAGLKDSVSDAVNGRQMVNVLGPTKELPNVLASADIVISAAGTSAWDICTMGTPAVLVALVDNQLDSLQQAIAHGVALGINAVGSRKSELANIGKVVDRLASEPGLRRELSSRCFSMFDGLGKIRVVEAMEREQQRSCG